MKLLYFLLIAVGAIMTLTPNTNGDFVAGVLMILMEVGCAIGAPGRRS